MGRQARGDVDREAGIEGVDASQQGSVAQAEDQGQGSAPQGKGHAQACYRQGAVGRLFLNPAYVKARLRLRYRYMYQYPAASDRAARHVAGDYNPVCDSFGEALGEARGIASDDGVRRHVLSDDSAGRDDRVVADGNAFEDDGIHPDQTLLPIFTGRDFTASSGRRGLPL